MKNTGTFPGQRGPERYRYLLCKEQQHWLCAALSGVAVEPYASI